MITLNFSVDDQLLTRTDENTVAANSHLVHVCEFSFSSEWDGRGKVATFKKRDLVLSVILEDDACTIPPEILQSDNKIDVFELSVCGADGNSTITSTVVKVPILAGTWDVMSTEITPSMFEQIMQKIDEIEKGEVSPELVLEAVTEYLEAHPLEPIIAEDVAAYFVEHAEELKGAKGDTGATPDITATAEVNNAVGTPSVTVTKTGTEEAPNLNFAFQNLKGAKGDTGATPGITAAATVDNTTGTPAVNVTKSGTDAAPEFTFAFTGLKGPKGDPGTGAEELEEDVTSLWGITDKHNMANILPYNYFDGDGKLSSYVSYSVNEDKSININGTSTSYSFYRLVNKDTTFLRKGKYVISCEETLPAGVYVHVGIANHPSNPADIGTYLAIINENNDGSTSKAFEISENGLPIIVRIMVFPNASANNLNAHIMLRYASDPVTAWQSPLINANTLKEQIDNVDFYPCFSMFNKFGVVGDSFSSGYIAPNPNVHSFVTNYTLSWGQVLARLSGNTCQNFSEAGLTTKTWLTNTAHGKAALEAAAAQDLYVICLGINDYTTATYDLGSTADIGTATDSFYSYYSQIIECIQDHAPNAKIIVSTMRQGRAGGNASFTADQVNAAIEAIAEHYGLPCVKPSEDPLFTSAYYLTKMNHSHPVAAVYSAMAKAYKRLIEKAIENNFTYFESYTDNT